MSWDRHDGDNLHPHVTVAEKCGGRFDEAWAYVATRARGFDAELDNITVFRDAGGHDGSPRPALHAQHMLGL